MPRTITVKGIGQATASPDYVRILMVLESEDRDYDRAMAKAGQSLQHVNETLEAIGFGKESVKTTNFNVRTDYDYQRGAAGENSRIFRGYVVSHSLKLEFDFETGRLSQALAAIAGCLANPELNIAFTVRDKTAINEEMLKSATENARKKAEVLCAAAGVGLGTLLSISYDWSELNVYSNTRYALGENCAVMSKAGMDIVPEDISVSDTATFVWEIQ